MYAVDVVCSNYVVKNGMSRNGLLQKVMKQGRNVYDVLVT